MPNEIDYRITLKRKGFIRRPDGSYSKAAPVAAAVPTPEPQPDVGGPLARANENEKGSPRRTVVCFTAYRVSLQDADNNAGGCKYSLDGLRHAKLIQDDSPEHIQLVTQQVKVGSKEEEGTEILISEETFK